MQFTIHGQTLELVQGDITDQQVDAIVNAANSRLAGGGGVDGAIHRVGGPTIMLETDRLYPNGCPTGSAVISTGGKLAAEHVIHTVGPIWSGGTRDEDQLLANAYRSCLQMAVDHDCQSIAFPSLSTGAYGFPIDRASRIAVETVRDFLVAYAQPHLVRFVLFSSNVFAEFRAAAIASAGVLGEEP